MSTLYQIDEQIEELTNKLVDEETGEINEDALEELEKLKMDKDAKLEGCGLVMKQLAIEVDAINDEIKALKARATAKANRHDRIGEYVKSSLKGEKFETSKVAFSYRRSQKLEVFDEEIVPDDMCLFETKRSPAKAKIKQALKDGKHVPGCVLVEKMNLQVK